MSVFGVILFSYRTLNFKWAAIRFVFWTLQLNWARSLRVAEATIVRRNHPGRAAYAWPKPQS